MTGIALTRAAKGRLWPSFFFLLALVPAAVPAQQLVYRCGQLYTNVPADPARCKPVSSHAVTVINGARVRTYGDALANRPAAASQPKGETRGEAGGQRQRDDMARAIVVAELDKARQRHQSLEQEYRQTPADDSNPRRAQLKAAVERAQRDIESLQRELERRPPTPAQP